MTIDLLDNDCLKAVQNGDLIKVHADREVAIGKIKMDVWQRCNCNRPLTHYAGIRSIQPLANHIEFFQVRDSVGPEKQLALWAGLMASFIYIFERACSLFSFRTYD